MNKEQADRLVENAQKVFMDELKKRINETRELLINCKGGLTDSEAKHIERFFHSVNGTASTLGLHYLSSIGREWEAKLKNDFKQEINSDKAVLQDLFNAVDSIKRKIEHMDEKNVVSGILAENNCYVNMPDRGKILLIDDDITVLKLLENAFTMECYKVYICDDSVSAMDTIAAVRPDLIILDIMMPEPCGYKILELIKSNPEYLDIHVIFLSAMNDVDDRIYGMKSGADDYITKPFVITEVVTRVEMIMRRSKNYKEKLLKDYLTEAYSRYYFNLRIGEEFERYKRNGTIFSIAFIDMDRYKKINDAYGHQTGDCVLKELVSYLAANIRKCDSIYRYGGEEFIILMPDTTEEQAYIVIERLRRGLSTEPISIRGLTINITFSAGIRQVYDGSESIAQVINDADRAMYCAKRCGRNRVFIYNKEMGVEDSKKTLMIVDDESAILKLLSDRFSSIGYKVITAKDGANAVKLVGEAHPDVVILDITLPDIDGFEVCRKIKENPAAYSTKVIMLSRKKNKKSIEKGLRIGADDYIAKPFSIAELEARIIRVLKIKVE